MVLWQNASKEAKQNYGEKRAVFLVNHVQHAYNSDPLLASERSQIHTNPIHSQVTAFWVPFFCLPHTYELN